MPQVLFTESAERDLQEIGYQIAVAQGRVETAERMLRELTDQCFRLAEYSRTSQLGTTAPELGRDVRLMSHRSWVILFRYTESGITVLRFAGAGQDYLSWKL